VDLKALARIAATVTPTVPLEDPASGCTIWAKLEYQMPSGSTKDRIAAHILRVAVEEGDVDGRSLVVEASSGSTSIAFAMVCAALGVRFLAVLPEGVSDERVLIVQRYGGEVSLSPGELGLPGAIAASERMAAGDGHVFLPRQFSNPDNAAAHRLRTGPELVSQVGGPVDGFVAAVGTAGTLMGVGQALRATGHRPLLARVRVAGELDAEQGGAPCSGVPGVVDCLSTILDERALGLGPEIVIAREEALAATRDLCRRGFPVGVSSGLNLCGARRLAARLGPNHNVATVFCDRMERYFSTDLFADVR